MFAAFTGWHVLIILGVLLVFAAVIAGVVMVIVIAARRAAASSAPGTAVSRSIELRLHELERLRASQAITHAEYDERRHAILLEL